MRNSDFYTDRGGNDMFSALIDSVSERVAERICSRIEERLQQNQRSTQSSSLSVSADDPDQLITKAEACHLLDRCASTLSKWAERGGQTMTTKEEIEEGSAICKNYKSGSTS